jgi:predicted phage terminase large subunit-like protein
MTPTESTPTKAEIYAACRLDFGTFARKCYECLHPGEPLKDNYHIDAICYQMDRVRDGDNRNLMVLMPPRSLKSEIISVAWPAFLLGHDPTLRILVASYSQDLATSIHRTFRKLISHPEIQAIFPVFANKPAKDTESETHLSEGGFRKAVWVDGGVTGQGAHIHIIDDPLKASDADNEAVCAKTAEFFDNTFSSRTNSPAEFRTVLVMQRLSEYDLAGHFLKRGDFEVLKISAIAENDEKIPTGPGLFYHRKAGESFHEAHYPLEELEKRRRTMTPRAFSSQFQQNPTPLGGGLVDLSKFKRYETPPKVWDDRFISIDASSGAESKSYDVILVGRISNGRLYVTNVIRKKLSLYDLLEMVLEADAKYDFDRMVIEKTANGRELITGILRKYAGREDKLMRYPKLIQGITPTANKVARMEAAMISVAAGKVLLPKSAPWLEDFEAELRAFPEGKTDDQVDALSQAVKYFDFFMNDPLNRDIHGWPAYPKVK